MQNTITNAWPLSNDLITFSGLMNICFSSFSDFDWTIIGCSNLRDVDLMVWWKGFLFVTTTLRKLLRAGNANFLLQQVDHNFSNLELKIFYFNNGTICCHRHNQIHFPLRIWFGSTQEWLEGRINVFLSNLRESTTIRIKWKKKLFWFRKVFIETITNARRLSTPLH